MILRALAALAFSLPLLAFAGVVHIQLPALDVAELKVRHDTRGRMRVGTVRELPKAARAESWSAVEGGFVSEFSAISEGALGLRARLDLSGLTGKVEVRASGPGGRVETMQVDAANRSEAWTPWTEGETQRIQVFSATLPPAGSVALGAIAHFTESPFAKAAAACTVPTACTTGSTTLDAAVLQARKAVVRINFIDGGSPFICSGTLVDTERNPEPFFLTANHCIETPAAAGTLSTFWFFEMTACEGGIVDPAFLQQAGGAQLVFTNHNVDSTLLKLNNAPPAGAVYAQMNGGFVPSNTSMVSISHPRGDTGRLALGAVTEIAAVAENTQTFYGVRFNRGIVEGGSSGSPLLTLAGDRLQVRGTLFGTTVNNGPMSCTNPNEEAIYSRLDIFMPQIAQYIRVAPTAADDAPNRAGDYLGIPFSDPAGVDRPLNERGGTTLEFNNRRIDYAGDMDVYRFRLTASAYVSAWTEGTIDTLGAILDSQGAHIASNDDDNYNSLNFGLTQRLDAGTYYLQVGHYDATGTGLYSVRLRAETVDTNYTDLWWNPAESGWGVNINHQDNTLFATLFTYDGSGKALWLSMSGGTKQPDGSYLGDLFRTTGPAVDSMVWNSASIAYTKVGTMRFAFTSRDAGTLTYSVNGVQVTKAITRIAFATPPVCSWDRGDRAYVYNFQDLWWNPAESGWGLNITHQGDTLFATLFTYDAQGQPLWLVMSNGALSLESSFSYEGDLLRTTGPPFNAVPFTPIGPSNYTQVGTMTITFLRNGTGLLNFTYNGSAVSKTIERLTFGTLRTKCEEPTDGE